MKSKNMFLGAHILPDVTFHMHQDDFARLRGIAGNGVLARNVRSITYFTAAIESPAREAKPADDLTLWFEYEKYERLVAAQDQIRAGTADLACLKDALAKFTGLKHVTMSSGHLFYEGRAHEKPSPFTTPFPPPTHWPRPEGVRHLEVLLEALAHNNLKLESLRAGSFDWIFFDKSSTELEGLFRPLLDAVHVELEITLDLDDDLHDVSGNTGECRRFMDRGIIRDLLARMRRLELLRVGFMGDMDVPYKPAMLRDIVSPTYRWPHLNRLEISHVEVDRHTLMQFLVLHKDTLQFLCLQDFDLGETSWEKLLPSIRNTLHLECACICGTLTGQVEDVPEKGGVENWDLSRPGEYENDMRASINRYCRNGGEDYPDELPLTDEVVQKHFDQYVKCHVRKTQAQDWKDKCRVAEEVRRRRREDGLMPNWISDSELGWDGYDSDDLDDDDDDDDNDELVFVGHA
ncbi:hypothetical protein INS49_014460 [Diaporthe citri]|uniref:uncharacterized protein n=1 Tax=Diaporthe citri TaxID=83186 RepID=UPI001C81B21C|nr:uncharacterized protein INS49_014460 [Diaporthe citri]KAG6356587.1 hypothetical protein INS49_014460 [Diaporthe citri]